MPEKDSRPRPDHDNLSNRLHDLAQPLATVTGLVDLLLLELDERDKIFKEVQMMSDQLDKIMRIVGDIRLIAREAAAHEAKSQEPASLPHPKV
jgi:signal transduction histidine kinase